MEYKQFIQTKISKTFECGFDLDQSSLNANLFEFQKDIVTKALKKGRYAIFADCGMGKTIMQLEWANQVQKVTKNPVLILCPLAVKKQTIDEGAKFGIDVKDYSQAKDGLLIENYEQIDNIDTDMFSGIVLDESSILKNFTGKMRNLLTEKFSQTQYRLCCTATPSPNDPNEVGNHSQFLGVMDANDMRMRWFVRDEGMNNYRLKGHAVKDFYSWVSSWAVMIEKPSDIGYQMEGYDLPSLDFFEHQVEVSEVKEGQLFNDVAINATSFHAELRKTMRERMEIASKIANETNEQVIIWVNQDEEEKMICSMVEDAVAVRGSMPKQQKEKLLIGFGKNEFRVLVTKKKIAQFGLNYQNCHIQIFASLDFSFEGLYQAIRRSYRFGQKEDVQIHLVTTDTMKNVKEAINRKEMEFKRMKKQMIEIENGTEYGLKNTYDFKEYKTDLWNAVRSDCVEYAKTMPDNSVDFSVFSPPFSTLFTYSDHIHDMGNCESNEQFFEQTMYLLKELYRVIKNGRLVAVHTKDLAVYKGASGYSGMYDFTGDYHRAMEKVGFKYHSKITIWTDPVLEMQRTKTQRLLYKQVTSDSSKTGIGMPEYVTIFKKWEGDEENWTPITNKTKKNFDLDTWQAWASPIWMDIKRTDVLNDWRNAKEQGDEKHICPLQLGVIERLISLWSNKGELVYSPFMGIGSEGYEAVRLGRRFVGTELKEGYWKNAIENLKVAETMSNQMTLF